MIKMIGHKKLSIIIVCLLVIGVFGCLPSLAVGGGVNGWNVELRFVEYESLNDFYSTLEPDPPGSQVDMSMEIEAGGSIEYTGGTTLDEELDSPIAIIVEVQNSNSVAQTLTVPGLQEAFVENDTESLQVLAFYIPDSWFGDYYAGWATGMEDVTIEAEIEPGASLETLYLIPQLSGEVWLDLQGFGFFSVNSSSPIDTDGDGILDSEDLDDDNDGMPDEWENIHGFDPLNPSDALEDPDGDGYINYEEYINGTDPLDRSDYLEKPEEGIDLYLLLGVIIAILVIVVLAIFLLITKKNTESPQQPLEEREYQPSPAQLQQPTVAPPPGPPPSKPVQEPPSVAGQKKYCAFCGAELPGEAVFCGECGKMKVLE